MNTTFYRWLIYVKGMFIRFALFSLFLTLSIQAHSAPKCVRVFKNSDGGWRDSVSYSIPTQLDAAPVLLRIYNRPETRLLEEWYPKHFTVEQILNQDAQSLKLLAQLTWRLQSPLKVSEVLNINEKNESNVLQQTFDSDRKVWLSSNRLAPSMTLSRPEGAVRFIDLIEWANDKKTRPAQWAEKADVPVMVKTFNGLLLELRIKMGEFLRGKNSEMHLELEENTLTPYNSLDLTLAGQKSLLDNGEVLISISPNTVMVTPSKEFIVVSPF